MHPIFGSLSRVPAATSTARWRPPLSVWPGYPTRWWKPPSCVGVGAWPSLGAHRRRLKKARNCLHCNKGKVNCRFYRHRLSSHWINRLVYTFWQWGLNNYACIYHACTCWFMYNLMCLMYVMFMCKFSGGKFKILKTNKQKNHTHTHTQKKKKKKRRPVWHL